MTKRYVLIDSADALQEAIQHLANHVTFAFDTETTGLNVRKERVIGFSFTGEVGKGYYYPIWVYNKQANTLDNHPFHDEDNLNTILGLLKRSRLVMHNASFDIRIVSNNLKVNLLSSLHADTMLMEHTINEDGPFGLKDICIRRAGELGLDDQDAANQEQLDLQKSVIANGGKWIASNKEMYKADLDILSKYACADVDMTLRLYNYHTIQLANQGISDFFYHDEVMPLYKLVTIRMESRGIHINMVRLNELVERIDKDIEQFENVVIKDICETPEWEAYIVDLLNEEFPISNKGSFAQALCEYHLINLPRTANGKMSLTKKNIDTLPDSVVKDFLLTNISDKLDYSEVRFIQETLCREDNATGQLINIQSKSQLAELVFTYMGLEPLSKTAKGQPQFNETFVESIAADHKWADSLRVYNKLMKIRSSYYERFLENTEDGIYYPSFKQHGTSSGRYSSDFQQLPRPKDEDSVEHPLVREYSDSVRELVVAPTGFVFIDDDYESLEPRCFADDAGDSALIKIFTDNLDMYSVVAISAENIKDASADKKAPDFLKKKYPLRRQNAKAYALGIRYGMKAFKLSKTLDISLEEAQNIIDNYFKAFPGLEAKMNKYLTEVKTTGKVTSKFGRIRHLPRARDIYKKFGDGILEYNNLRSISTRTYTPIADLKDLRKEYNNLLNNALNFPIQSAATSIVNRAAIAMTKVFLGEKLNAWVSLQIHDQLVITCSEDCIDRVKAIVQNSMEQTNLLAMPLIAKPEVAHNLREGH